MSGTPAVLNDQSALNPLLALIVDRDDDTRRMYAEIRRLLARSAELCARIGRTQQNLTATFAEANRLRVQAQETRRQAQSRIYVRVDTMTPPIPAPPLVCPECDLPLNYMRSHVG